ncbi:MAG: hypothetical protein ACFB03_16145 [Paracoccaceae bacterium]
MGEEAVVAATANFAGLVGPTPSGTGISKRKVCRRGALPICSKRAAALPDMQQLQVIDVEDERLHELSSAQGAIADAFSFDPGRSSEPQFGGTARVHDKRISAE